MSEHNHGYLVTAFDEAGNPVWRSGGRVVDGTLTDTHIPCKCLEGMTRKRAKQYCEARGWSIQRTPRKRIVRRV